MQQSAILNPKVRTGRLYPMGQVGGTGRLINPQPEGTMGGRESLQDW
jgi:hypothetical protein